MSDRLRADACRDDLYRARTALSEAVRRHQEAEARLTEALVEIDRLRAENEQLRITGRKAA